MKFVDVEEKFVNMDDKLMVKVLIELDLSKGLSEDICNIPKKFINKKILFTAFNTRNS